MRKNFLGNYGAKNPEQKIERGGLKNVDVFDKEPGLRRAASILPCLDLGGDRLNMCLACLLRSEAWPLPALV